LHAVCGIALINDVQLRTRRDFISLAGKSFGLAALSSGTVASLFRNVEAASKNVAHLTPEEAALLASLDRAATELDAGRGVPVERVREMVGKWLTK